VHQYAFFCSLPIGVALVLSAPTLGAAGATYTAFALLILHGLALAILIAMWGAVGLGVAFNLLWVDAPKPLSASRTPLSRCSRCRSSPS
jgi:hypothetical protein